ncbi:MAG TPA: hypothetical protein VJ346_08215 [Bacteroidales bacterium]|nr:hypothetical protein [Bacteroidales bacterium]
MFERVNVTLEKNLAKWNGITAFREIYDEFMKNFAKLKKMSEKQIQKSDTLYNAKNRLLDQLVEKVMPLANILEVYGMDHKEKRIKPIKITRNKLSKSKDSVVLKKCGYVLQTSRKLFNKALKKAERIKNEDAGTSILNYGLTEGMIHELEVSYDKFKKESEYVGNLLKQEKKIAGKIKTLVNQNKKLLGKKLDKLMILFESKDPEFHQLYQQSREAAPAVTEKRPNPVGRPRKTQQNRTLQDKTPRNKTPQKKTRRRRRSPGKRKPSIPA